MFQENGSCFKRIKICKLSQKKEDLKPWSKESLNKIFITRTYKLFKYFPINFAIAEHSIKTIWSLKRKKYEKHYIKTLKDFEILQSKTTTYDFPENLSLILKGHGEINEN